MLSRLPVVVLALSLCLPALAQAPSPQPERRTFAVSVLDKDGNAVHGLTAANFRGTYRGQPVKILSAAEDSSPRRIALLIDRSASARANDDAEFVWPTVRGMIENTSASDRLTLLTFNDSLEQHCQLTGEREALLKALERAQNGTVRGSTALFDALVQTGRMLTPGPLGDSAILLSDGIDNASRVSFPPLEEAVARSGLRVVIVLMPSPQAGRDARAGRRQMLQLTEASAGLVLEPRGYNRQAAVETVRRIRELTQSFYILEVEVPETTKRPQDWTLEVVDAEGAVVKGLEAAYSRRLIPAEKKK